MVAAAAGADLKISERDLPRVPATEPSNAVATVRMRDGVRAEIVAAEPLVASPVAMSFDELGRLYVVEMIDYSERREEQLGRVKLLEDTNADGKFDKATIYANKLPWPTAIIAYGGGAFVGASPDILFLKDTNNDGRADVRRVIFTGFGGATPKLNVQQLLNSFTWGLDNRIHGALGGNASVITNLAVPDAKPLALRNRDFSFDPRTFDVRPESGGGQFGISFDDEGNKFTSSNSRHLIADMFDVAAASRNRFYAPPAPDTDIPVDGPAAEIYRISPDEPWRVVRTQWRIAGAVPGPVEGGGRVSGYFSGAGGLVIYRGDALPAEYYGNAFVTDCGGNLVHRKQIHRDGLVFRAERPVDEQKREFMASTDNWFRPVAAANGPDGALYVIDMYREIIEHPWSLPPELKQHLDLNSGNDRGRIYRVAPIGFKSDWRPVKADLPGLAKLLEHRNGWHRDTAARLIFERNDVAAAVPLRALLTGSSSRAARLHALHLLRSLGALRPEDLARARSDSDGAVRSHAVRLSVTSNQADAPPISDPDIRVRYESAFRSTNAASLGAIIARDVESSWMRVAVLSGAERCAPELLSRFANDAAFLQRTGAVDFTASLATIVGAAANSNDLARVLPDVARSPAVMRLAEALGAGLARAKKSLGAPELAPLLTPVFERARALVADVTQPQAQRIAATRLLRFTSYAASGGTLDGLLRLNVSPALQMAAANSLVAFHDGRGVTNLLGRWETLAPQTRTHSISLLLSRPADTAMLLDEVENGVIAKTEFTPADLQRLSTTGEPVNRQRAQEIFRRAASTRAEVLQQYRPALELKGDVTRGHKVYTERCASCHRVGKEGFFVGPDLESVAANGKEKLLASVLDPNAEVAANYVAYTVETKSGDTYLAVLAGDDPNAVSLKMPNGEAVQVPRADIASLRSSDRSMMPEGIEAGMTNQEMADLLEFMVKAGAAKK